MKFEDLTGLRFGNLTVISRVANGKDGATRYLCKCDCGNTKEIRSKHLKSGIIDNCGCQKRKKTMETRIRKGTAHGGSETRLYRIWCGMKCRCYNTHRKRYPDYGGRGIAVCEEWKNSFEAFRDWALSNGYSDNLTIDRINDNEGYRPDNCRWATITEQNNNRRKRSCWRKESTKP